jgi:hypothetical protein
MKLLVLVAVLSCMFGLTSSASAIAIADYSLDGNTVDDISSNTAPSTDVTPTTDRFGTGSGALDFNGTTSIVNPVNVGLDDHTQDFSVSLWLRPDAIGTYQGLFSNNTPSSNNNDRWNSVGRLEADGSLLFLVGAAQESNAEIAVTTTAIVSASEWTHVAMLYDVTGGTGTISIYLNGIFEGSSSKAYVPTPLTTTETWFLGAQNDNGTAVNYFDGGLDDFQIYDTVLSVPEIQALAVPEPTTSALTWLTAVGLAIAHRNRPSRS